ncbi:uncharacterized protein LOC107196102 isoform X2 [Pteropus alecto]|uniref:uncharacterized protein LOC107196102 isoform X2 n=1 Tax=Pteropus alecto TaxID=9402 RepID=UPI000D534E49|nr:uncharacterized protein LOC107196102 isoform X2 [Pteropus alecto]
MFRTTSRCDYGALPLLCPELLRSLLGKGSYKWSSWPDGTQGVVPGRRNIAAEARTRESRSVAYGGGEIELEGLQWSEHQANPGDGMALQGRRELRQVLTEGTQHRAGRTPHPEGRRLFPTVCRLRAERQADCHLAGSFQFWRSEVLQSGCLRDAPSGGSRENLPPCLASVQRRPHPLAGSPFLHLDSGPLQALPHLSPHFLPGPYDRDLPMLSRRSCPPQGPWPHLQAPFCHVRPAKMRKDDVGIGAGKRTRRP